MGEFYASGEFLDRDHLFKKYYSLISVITLQANTVQYTANKLKKYSGFGIESQVRYLKAYYDMLRDYKEDIRTEFNSLVKIIDMINDSENKAAGILGSMENEYKLDGYDTVGNAEKGSSGSFSKIFPEFFEVIADAEGYVDDAVSYFHDVAKIVPDCISDFFSDYMSPFFDFFSGINDVINIINFYSDGIISAADVFGTIKYSESVIEKSMKIAGAIKGVKLFPGATTAINETVKVGGTYIGQFTQYVPVLGVILETLYSGAQTYDSVSADGKVDAKDWAEIGIDAGIDGLIACGEALIAIACPPAAIGVALFEIADFAAEHTELGKKIFNGKSIKNSAKDEIKKGAEFLGKQLGKLMGRAVPA